MLLALAVVGAAEPSAAERPQPSAAQVLEFADKGWTVVRGAVPELREPDVEAACKSGEARSAREYANYSVAYLRDRHGFDVRSAGHVAECGPVDDAQIAANASRAATHEFFKRLRCSVALANRNGTGHACADLAGGPNFRGCGATANLPAYRGLDAHRGEPRLRAAATAPTLGEIAARLLMVDRVRLYQTAIHVKDPAAAAADAGLNDATAWHADLLTVPLDVGVGGYVTIWCPLTRELDRRRDSVLQFASGSHRDVSARQWFGAGRDRTRKIIDAMAASRASPKGPHRYGFGVVDTLDVGDCSAHSGWLFHAAPPQKADRGPRRAVAFSYVSADAVPLEDLAAGGARAGSAVLELEDELSFRDWLPAAAARGDLDDPARLPVVFPGPAPPAATPGEL